jgi:hypothetical protein
MSRLRSKLKQETWFLQLNYLEVKNMTDTQYIGFHLEDDLKIAEKRVTIENVINDLGQLAETRKQMFFNSLDLDSAEGLNKAKTFKAENSGIDFCITFLKNALEQTNATS